LAYTRNWLPPQRKEPSSRPIDPIAEQTAQAKNISIEEVMAESTQSIPIGRMIKPSEIGALAVFLLSDLAASITGAEILIDGGLTPGI
jgi:3-oxoacyl-[acyl-carrier protein] reductase/bacilysin biosynthesis oxidoreductase BacG